jgi:glyoxylase I family protein
MLKRIDHVYLTVSDFARSEAFYDAVMEKLGQHKGDKAIAGEPHAHYIGPQFQLTIRPAKTERAHDPYAPGLHHVCFQVASRADVDRCHASLVAIGVAATPPHIYAEYNPEYYATFFEDPDGIRLEIVAETGYRRTVEARWDELGPFVNPVQSLSAKKEGSR